jgi:hypothetical protein
MDVAADCEAPGAFYRAEEGGEMVPWRRNGRRLVEFINAPVLGRREEGAVPVSEGKGARGAALGSRVEGRLEVVGVRRRRLD